jgi:NAD(P)-dependent dehydrogenase (short-subunit alcohol dehydrogenase family)
MTRIVDTPVAIVTGAGMGIGAACARGLAADGMSIVLVGRNATPLDAVQRELAGEGARAIVVAADIGLPETPAAVVAAARDEFGRVDAIVNNAAIIIREAAGSVTVENFDAQVAVNVRAPLLLAGAALPLLTESDRASIVNISSSSAVLNRRGQCVYAMTKAAVNYLTRSLAVELAPLGVRVNTVSPGPVDTPSHRSWTADRAELEAALLPQIPIGRVGEADDVALWVRHLCAPSAGWVTGAVIAVDGGQSISFR